MVGTFSLSLDTELAWGSFDVAMSPRLVAAAEWTHQEGIPRLLDILCRDRISATWAFVGHVTLRECNGHEKMTPVQYEWFRDDWFRYDPKSDEGKDPAWYGRSAFLKVLKASHFQEIGFHSFSHVLFSHSGTPRARAREEFLACRAIADEFGLPAPAFIFPRNAPGYLDELRSAGFRCYRSPDVHLMSSSRLALLRKVIKGLADIIGLVPYPVTPFMNEGLVILPGSLLLRSMDGWRSWIPASSRRARVRRGLDRCVREGGIFHLWFHPINLYAHHETMFGIVEDFCDLASRLRDRGDLRILTLGQIAEEYIAKNEAMGEALERQGALSSQGQGRK